MSATPIEETARRVLAQPRESARLELDALLTWSDDDAPGSPGNVAHMEFNARLVTAIRLEAERQSIVPPWGR